MTRSHRILEIQEGAGVQGQQPHFAGGGSPVDEHEREGLSPVFVVAFIRQDDESRSAPR